MSATADGTTRVISIVPVRGASSMTIGIPDQAAQIADAHRQLASSALSS